MKQILFKSIFLLFTAMFLNSCITLKPIPLRGTYLDKPYEVVSDKSFDEVWSNVIDLFATEGLSIKLIDRSSGLIVSEKTSFINDYTFENEMGKLENPDASIVLQKVTYEGHDKSFIPEKITGEWNVRIKENQNGQTLVNVNVTNIDASLHISTSQSNAGQTVIFQGKSTGNFEKQIAELVK